MLRKSLGRSWKVAATFVAATAFIGPVGQAVAQTDAAGANVQDIRQAGLEWIKVRNVRSGLMAWALDPARHPDPIEVHAAKQAESRETLQPSDLFDLPPTFQLPAGIVSVSSVDAQNTLAIVGHPQSVAQLKTIIEGLDHPISQVEVAAQVVSIEEAELGQFGLNPTSLDRNANQPQVLAKLAPADFQQRLDGLVGQGKAKQKNNPRMTLMNRLGGRLGQIISIPAQVKLTVGEGPDNFQQELDALPQDITNGILRVEQESSLRAKAVFLDKNTASLSLTAVKNLRATGSLQREERSAGGDFSERLKVPLKTQEHSLIMNVGDGQTMMVSGLYPELAEDKASPTNVITFVTVKFLRRSED